MPRAAARLAFALLALAAAAPCGAMAAQTAAPPSPAPAAAPPVAMPKPFTDLDYSIGNPRAKVTLVEYLSVACPHCARFDAEVFPALKAKYVDTGKVRYVMREMLVGDQAMAEIAAAGFLTARCAGRAHYFAVVEAMFRAQADIFKTGDLKGPLTRIAQGNGLDAAQLDACLNDKANLDALNARVKDAQDVHKIDHTPSFLVNNVKLDEHDKEPDLALFDAAFQPLLKTR